MTNAHANVFAPSGVEDSSLYYQQEADRFAAEQHDRELWFAAAVALGLIQDELDDRFEETDR